jgi:hypothetical protein
MDQLVQLELVVQWELVVAWDAASGVVWAAA